MKQMRVDLRRNRDGKTDVTFSLQGHDTIKVDFSDDLETMKFENPISITELSTADLSYYFYVFKTLLEKQHRLKQIEEGEQ